MYKPLWALFFFSIMALVLKGKLYLGQKTIQGLEISAENASLVSVSTLDWQGDSYLMPSLGLTQSQNSLAYGLSSVPSDPDGLMTVVSRKIREALSPEGQAIEIVPLDPQPPDRHLTETCDWVRVGLRFETIPLCTLEIKAHRCLGDASTLILGKVPSIQSLSSLEGALPQWSESLGIFEQWLALQNETGEIREKSLCLLSYEHTLKPVWRVLFTFRSLPYEAFLNDQNIYQVSPQAFDFSGSGSVQTFDRNSEEETLKTYSIPDFTGDGTLTTSYFSTQTQKFYSDEEPRAVERDLSFVFAPDDPKFPEASAFAHAYEHHEFFKSLGYQWIGPGPLTLFLHGQDVNNATYSSDTGSGKPGITLGDGDGLMLQNLSTDRDVVSHEFGHHVIMKNLKATTGESLVLHEGLADFFTFASEGDACLGESICPESSGICVVPGRCLRTGDNSLVFGSSAYMKMGAHQRGQIVSGLLWDLRKFMDPKDVTQIAYNTVNFLVSNSGINDFLKGILFAENAMTSGKYCTQIIQQMQKRGFSSIITKENIACSDTQSFQTPTGNPASTQITANTPAKKSKSSSGCGLLGQSDTSKSAVPVNLLFFAWPLILGFWSLRRRN